MVFSNKMKVKKKIKARSISSIRKAEFSKAAFEAVIRYGLRGTTLEKVGEIAGVSKGVVLHHFKDKSSLLEAVFRRSNAVLSKSFVELVRYGQLPMQIFPLPYIIKKSVRLGSHCLLKCRIVILANEYNMLITRGLKVT
jgi:AcrR family transcriptional regulator